LINGDISNETSPRILVLIDVVANSEVVETKKILRTTTERKVTSLNNLALSHLWNLADKYGLSVELVGYSDEMWTQEHLDLFMERLDKRGGNPFNYAELYVTLEDLLGELPYRANLRGVIDLKERVARYGSWGIELNNL
jgi:hypothetical protein